MNLLAQMATALWPVLLSSRFPIISEIVCFINVGTVDNLFCYCGSLRT